MSFESLPSTASNQAEEFLCILARSGTGFPASLRSAVVVAHPDDEAIGAGGQLSRFENLTVIVVTDGAPRDNFDAHLRGFSDWRAYANERRRELEAAMTLAGVGREDLLTLNVPDKQAALHLADISHALASIASDRSLNVIITH